MYVMFLDASQIFLHSRSICEASVAVSSIEKESNCIPTEEQSLLSVLLNYEYRSCFHIVTRKAPFLNVSVPTATALV
jgi:hypothetical protein